MRTDNEIIMGLESIIARRPDSLRPYTITGLTTPNGTEIALKDIIDLLNRQKAEKDKAWELFEKRTEENIELQKICDRQKVEIEKYTTNFARVAKLIKSEAYHEFAERLKCGVPQETGVIRCKDVDFTLTELTERKEDEGK